MLPSEEICERARLARDPRFDGRFFVGVVTTGIYCRPVCPARPPAPSNVRFFPSAAAAQDAGYRPCLRCRPEGATPLPEWGLASSVVVRGLRLIQDGFLNEHPVIELADRLGVGVRQLGRLFHAELGASPHSVARQQRLQLAKRLIDETTSPLHRVAELAGFGSVRRFNAEVRAVYGCPPRDLRRNRRGAGSDAISLTLPVRTPYHHDWVFGFHGRRALTGIERVPPDQHVYTRRIDCGDVAVCRAEGGLRVAVPAGANLVDCLSRVRRMFDVAADPAAIGGHLAGVPGFAPWVAAAPGLRVPGAWDGFEQTVRAILGQQVSVARATELAGRMVDRYGSGRFPTAGDLTRATPAELGMPGRRGAAITTLARAVCDGRIRFDADVEAEELTARLCAIDGIGPWTAGYVAMRVGGDPDALPDNDWVLLKRHGTTAAGLRRMAESWRPWRAYGVMYTWYAAAMDKLAAAGPAANGRVGNGSSSRLSTR